MAAAAKRNEDDLSDTGSAFEKKIKLRPLKCLEPGVQINMALIVLNQPLDHQYSHLLQLWNRSTIRAATDGASNHLHDIMVTREGTDFVPHLLTGDFDSARPEVLDFMRGKGAEIVETADQDYTDFTKCLRVVHQRTLENNNKVDCLVALGAFGGRFDHTLSAIDTLYDASKTVGYPVYLIGDDNIACLLKPNQSMEFGGLISTSNSFDSEAREVTVTTDSHVVWAMGIRRQ